MASSEDFQTAICSGGGWWNAGRGLCPPCAAPLSDFMWSDSSQNDMDERGEMKQAAATYSRSDDSSDDHHSSSAHQHLPVLSSDYAQMFQHVQKPPEADFCVSDWSKNFLMHDQNNNNNQGFYDLGQFDTTAKVSQMGLDNIASSSYLYPAILQSLTGPDTDMNYGFDNRFGPSTTNLMQQQQQQFYATTPSPKQHLNSGTKPSNNNSLMPFWDSWMGSDEIGTPESHQIPAPAMFEDRKPYICGNTITGRSFISSKVSSNDLAQKVAGSNLLGTKRKNTSTSDDLYKRLRMETPSSLPTFKVRKEKLGDRITALQQLVSPFGKTDTASVLHEAIEYIKFLHDQVCVLRTPYMQNGAPTNHQQQMQKCESKNPPSEGPKQDLRSRGLCLVPISSTFPVATETTADFWTPTFGGTISFR